MGHSSTDMRIHVRINRDINRHTRIPIHTAARNMGSTDLPSRRMPFRVRIRGSRRHCVRRLRRLPVVPPVTAIAIGKGIDITHAPWVGADGRGRGRSATDKGICHEDSRRRFAVCVFAFCAFTPLARMIHGISICTYNRIYTTRWMRFLSIVYSYTFHFFFFFFFLSWLVCSSLCVRISPSKYTLVGVSSRA